MIKAAKSGAALRVKELLELDASLISARDSDGSTPLHCATWKGHQGVVEVADADLLIGEMEAAKSRRPHSRLDARQVVHVLVEHVGARDVRQ